MLCLGKVYAWRKKKKKTQVWKADVKDNSLI
jgi:hypothetical protein